MEKKFIFCFDIDNTICKTVGSDYKNSKPKKKIINKINKLYNNGHTIKIYTARYMGRNKDNVYKANKQGYRKTYNQLIKWGLKFHKLSISKPSSDVYIDDKALGYKSDWFKKFSKLME
tara:strand:+ start:7087 stop:7440 length:354 start_codon:yes stop_codon:yes gene_type:complete